MPPYPAALSVNQVVKSHRQASREFRKEIRQDSGKAREFLLQAGILEKDKNSPSGVKLAKRYQS